jgi:NADPH2:quinone reductase
MLARELMVTFGQSSGPIEPIPPVLLSQKGSLFLMRPLLFHYIETPQELERRRTSFLRWSRRGK